MLNYIVPLLTFPYLTRVLGVESFGFYSLYLAIMMFLMLVITFGFDLSATVTISNIRNKKRKLKVYLSCVLLVKLMVMLLLLLLFFLSCLFGLVDVSFLKNLIYIAPALIGIVFSCQYLFQANGKLAQLAIITGLSRIITVPLTFAFIHSPDDFKYAIFIQSISYFICNVISVIYLIKTNQLELTKVSKKSLFSTASDGFTIFKFNFATAAYTNAIPLIIAVLAGARDVGIFNVANTVRGVISNFFSVVTRVLFPSIAGCLAENNIRKAKSILNKVSRVLLPMQLLVVAIIWMGSPIIVKLLAGEGYEDAIWVLRCLLLVSTVVLVNNFAGVQTILAMGFKNEFSNVIVKASFASLFIAIPLIHNYHSVGGALSMLITELLILTLLMTLHRKLGVSLIFPFVKTGNKSEL